VIAVDTNILVYAHREDAPFHLPAARCLSELAQGRSAWAIPWPCLHEFLSVVTHSRIYKPASTIVEAIDQIDAWLDSPSLVLLAEADRHWFELRKLLAASHKSIWH
jgi:predicted nucleic acid-binding protein